MRDNGIGSESDAKLYDNTIFIDAHRYGMLPLPSNNSTITVSCTRDISTIPFRKVSFDVGSWLKILEYKGVIQSLENYRYVGGIIAGVELWGRAKVAVQVKKHAMKDYSEEVIPEGKFILSDNSMWYSDGNGWACRYVNLSHASESNVQGITYKVNTIPDSMIQGWCPGSNTIPLF